MSITSTMTGQPMEARGAIREVLRRDFLRFWPLIALWAMVSATVGWQFYVVASGDVLDYPSMVARNSFGPAAVVLTLLLAAWSAYDDRLFDRHAFWRTRPLPPSAVAIAKILFIAAAIGGPPVFCHGALALAAGMPVTRLPEFAFLSFFGSPLVLGLWIAFLVVVSSDLWRAFLLFVATTLAVSLLYSAPWTPQLPMLPTLWGSPLERSLLRPLWFAAISGLLLLVYSRGWRWRSLCAALLILPLISLGSNFLRPP